MRGVYWKQVFCFLGELCASAGEVCVSTDLAEKWNCTRTASGSFSCRLLLQLPIEVFEHRLFRLIGVGAFEAVAGTLERE